MRLLVTNDDGVDSVFLKQLVTALLEAGHELWVAAPKTEQSWIGAAKSRNRPVAVCGGESRQLGCRTWVIDGTPSDCVNIAMEHLVPSELSLDAVVSGINIGMNATLGFIIASGTVSGALEGALHGLPAIALSQDMDTKTFERIREAHGKIDASMEAVLKESAKHAARMIPALIAQTPSHSFQVHNINFPHDCHPESKTLRTVPAHVIVPRLFTPADDKGEHRMNFRYGEDLSPGHLTTDRMALAQNCISHSILDYKKLGLLP